MTDLSRRDFFGRAAAASGSTAFIALPAPALTGAGSYVVGGGGGMILETLKCNVEGLDELEAIGGRLERMRLPLLRAGAEECPDPNLDADIDCLRSVSRVVKYRMQNERDRQREL